MNTIEVRDIGELGNAAKALIHFFDSVRLVILHGQMGAGKTTLVKTILSELSTVDQGNSPTFSLINVYEGKTGQKIYHLDLYRLNNMEKLIRRKPSSSSSIFTSPYGRGNNEITCSGHSKKHQQFS